MTCDECENRMCKDAPFFTQERIAKECLDNGRKLYVPPISMLEDMLDETEKGKYYEI